MALGSPWGPGTQCPCPHLSPEGPEAGLKRRPRDVYRASSSFAGHKGARAGTLGEGKVWGRTSSGWLLLTELAYNSETAATTITAQLNRSKIQPAAEFSVCKDILHPRSLPGGPHPQAFTTLAQSRRALPVTRGRGIQSENIQLCSCVCMRTCMCVFGTDPGKEK